MDWDDERHAPLFEPLVSTSSCSSSLSAFLGTVVSDTAGSSLAARCGVPSPRPESVQQEQLAFRGPVNAPARQRHITILATLEACGIGLPETRMPQRSFSDSLPHQQGEDRSNSSIHQEHALSSETRQRLHALASHGLEKEVPTSRISTENRAAAPPSAAGEGNSNSRHRAQSADRLSESVLHGLPLRGLVAEQLVQELHDITQLIEERSRALKRQESEITRVHESLKAYAQHLLQDAAQEFARVAEVYRKRAEAATQEALKVLRRASAHQAALHSERKAFRQQQQQQHHDRVVLEHEHHQQQTRLHAALGALESEKQRTLALEERIDHLLQENARLRSEIGARASLRPGGGEEACPARRSNCSKKGASGCSLLRPSEPQVACRRKLPLTTGPKPAGSSASRLASARPVPGSSGVGAPFLLREKRQPLCCRGAKSAAAHKEQPQGRGTQEDSSQCAMIDVNLRLPALAAAAAEALKRSQFDFASVVAPQQLGDLNAAEGGIAEDPSSDQAPERVPFQEETFRAPVICEKTHSRQLAAESLEERPARGSDEPEVEQRGKGHREALLSADKSPSRDRRKGSRRRRPRRKACSGSSSRSSSNGSDLPDTKTGDAGESRRALSPGPHRRGKEVGTARKQSLASRRTSSTGTSSRYSTDEEEKGKRRISTKAAQRRRGRHRSSRAHVGKITPSPTNSKKTIAFRDPSPQSSSSSSSSFSLLSPPRSNNHRQPRRRGADSLSDSDSLGGRKAQREMRPPPPLREGIAQRLRASLSRLQEQEILHEKMQRLTQQLLHPQLPKEN